MIENVPSVTPAGSSSTVDVCDTITAAYTPNLRDRFRSDGTSLSSAVLGRSVNAYLPKATDRPPADERREPVHGTLIESERHGGHRELFAMAYEHTALTV